MDLDDITPGLQVRTRGDGSLGGGPGVLVGVVERLDGEYVQLSGAQPEDPQSGTPGPRWVPLAWIDRLHGGVLTLNRTAREFGQGVLWERPGTAQNAPTRPS